ncbi:MAG TPA: DSD1 family PLP-dependent enzyme [Acidobacteriota bacterium]|jgi:D-serine deaminase-like pyridoxal phosphate-dependent protein
MNSTRRTFVSSLLPVSMAALPAARKGYSMAEIDRKASRGVKAAKLSKPDLPTPALLVDLDVFEANIKKMAAHARAAGKNLRPHAKTHKSAEAARRQQAAGAIGVCVATVPEAEVMVRGGIRGVLLTSPIMTAGKMERMVRLAGEEPALIVAVDHPRQVELYQAAAAAARRRLNVVVDLSVGDGRTGAASVESALDLAKLVDKSGNLKLRGAEAYSGRSSHTVGFEKRRAYSHEVMAAALNLRERLRTTGLPADVLSGGSTGTYNIDTELDGITELQVGSYIFMDVDYRRIGGKSGEHYEDFAPSLSVLATVVSANQKTHVTLDAGVKAFSTDRQFGPVARDIQGVSYGWGGDEFGILRLENPSREVKLGDRLEFIVPHCDPTVNLYDRIYACRGDQVEEIWSVMDRWREAKS